jgi:hypothetical protein
MILFLVIGGLKPDFEFGELTSESWMVYENARNPRAAAEQALEQIDDSIAPQHKILVVACGQGKASMNEFLWTPRVEGRLTTL